MLCILQVELNLVPSSITHLEHGVFLCFDGNENNFHEDPFVKSH